jgi:aspartate/methionine/tyrosine aminotransferase
MKTFETEDYFSEYEFTKPYQLASSDCESVSIAELIQMGGGSIDAFSKTKLSYPEMQGSRPLRAEIGNLYKSVKEDQILILGSPIEGIYLSLRALVKQDEHVIVLSPAYDALYNISEHITKNTSRWFLKNDGKSWSLDFEQLESLVHSKTKLLIINFPHNPTGFMPSQAELKKIVEIAEKYKVRIFSDEIYRGLEFGAEAPSLSLADMSENAIVMSGASKGLGLPGLRFGWLAVKDMHLYKELLNLKSYTSMCSPQTLEYLGTMAIKAAPKLLEKNLKIVTDNILAAEVFFEKWSKQLNWLKPVAGSVSVVKVNEPSAEQFCHMLATKFGVVLLPIKYMGYEDKYFRIGLGRLDFKTNLDAFDKALSAIYLK